MSDIASLGLKIDSTDATRAAGELDKLTTAGGRTEQAAKRVERAWEQAVQRTAAEMNTLNGRVDVLNGTQSKMLAAVERVASQMDRMAAAYERSSRAADNASRAYGAVGREAGASAGGVDRVNRSLTQTETSASAAGASIRRYLLTALGSLSVMRMADIADDWGEYSERIRMATRSAEEYRIVEERMAASAQATYRHINETKESFIQLSPVLRSMGLNLEQSIDAVDTFSGLLVVNAASSDRAQNAMRALSVATQKGKMDVDAWMSIASTMPTIIDLIADSTGKTEEEIRKLGASGTLSIEMLVQALVQGYLPTMEKVEGMRTTFGDALTNLSTEFGEFIGKANQANDVTGVLVDGIELVSENLAGVLTVALVATAAGLARYTAGMGASAAATVAKSVQARLAAAEELKLAQAQLATAQASVAQTVAMRGLTATMAQQTAAATALAAAEHRVAAAKGAAAIAGSGLLGVLAGPVGVAATVALVAAGFLSMSGSANAASSEVDGLSGSIGELNKRQLELRRFSLEDEVSKLEQQAISSSQILQTMQSDYAALTEQYGENYEGMENVRRALLEQEEAHERNLAALDKSRDSLYQTVVAIDDLDAASRTATGGINGLNAALGFTEAGEKYLAQIQGRIKALQDGGDPVKAATRWILEHADASEADKTAIMSAALAEQALQKARDSSAKATKAGTSAINDAKKAAEAFEKERRQYLNGLYSEVSALGAQARGLEQQVALYGLAESATYDYTIAQLEQEKAALVALNRETEVIAVLERKIELLHQMKGSQQSLERLDAEKRQWEQWSGEVEQVFQQLGQSFTDYLFDGGKSARDMIRDLFKNMVLRVAVQPIMGAMQGMVTNQLGGMMGYSNPGQGSGVLGMAQNANSMYQAYSGGMASSMGQGIGVLGEKLGSEAMRSFAMGMTGAAGAAGTVAGITSVGAGLGASLGASVGTSAATMATTSFSASLAGGAGAATAATAGASGLAGAGAALGAAMPWIGGALAIGSLVGGGLFDREPTTRREQRTQVEFAGGAFGITKTDGRAAQGADAAARQLAEQAVQTANDIFKQVGVDAAIDSFHAIMASSYKGDRDGVASGGRLRIGDEYRQFGIANEGNPTIQGFGGWSDQPTMPRLATDIKLSILEAFQEADVLSSILDGIDIRGLSDAAAAELSATIQAIVQEVGVFQTAIESLPFANLRDLSFDAAAGLIAAAGGLDNLNAGMSSYFQNFYSEAEQLDHAAQQMGTAFASLGMEMPDVTAGAEAAKAAYRGIVESLDVTTESGQQAFAALMGLSGGFAELVTGFEELNGTLVDTTGILRERQSLEVQLLQLQGNTAALRRRELAGLDASNHALQQHIWSLQDQAAALQTAKANLESAYQAVVQAGQAEIQRLQQSFGATDTAMSSYRTAVQRLESEFGSLFTSIDRYVSDLRGNIDAAAKQQYDQARAVISTTLVTGQLPQTADLSEALRVAQQGVTGGVYASQFEQDKAYAILANEMEALKAIAEPELDTAKATLEQLENQYRLMRGMGLVGEDSLSALGAQLRTAISTEAAARSQIAAIEAEIDIAREQYNVLLEIRDGILSFPDALAEFAKAISAPALGGVGGGGGSNAGLPWEQYPNPVGVGSDYQRAVDYYRENPDVASAFNNSSGANFAEFAKEHYEKYGRSEGRKSFAIGTNYVPYDMTANIHKGEIIIDPRSSDILRRYGIGVQGGGTDKELIAEVRALREQVARLEAPAKQTAQSTTQLADQFDNVTAGGNAMGAEVLNKVEVTTA